MSTVHSYEMSDTKSLAIEKEAKREEPESRINLATCKVIVAVPTFDGKIDGKAVQCIFGNFSYAEQFGVRMAFTFGRGQPVDRVRNDLIIKLLESADFTHIWYVDGDMEPPPDTLKRLLSRDVDVVGAAYANRHETHINAFSKEMPDLPHHHQAYDGLIIDNPGLYPVSAMGAGCLLCKRTALVTMMEYFKPKCMAGEVEYRNPWFEWLWLGEKAMLIGEDMTFIEKVNMAGLGAYVDSSIIVPHGGECTYDLTMSSPSGENWWMKK